MGIFDRFKKTKKKPAEEIELMRNVEEILATQMEKKKVNLDLREDRIGFVKDNCELIIESSKQVEESRAEYQLVASYLTDMQRIDQIPVEEREDIDDAARKIITLSRDRANYQQTDSKITEAQYKHMDKYQEVIQKEIVKLQEKESYQQLIKNDLVQLEGEKGYLIYQKKDIIAKQKYLKVIAMVISIITILLFFLFAIIATITKSDMTIPYIMSVCMAMFSVTFIIYHARKNQYDIKLVERKINRAIGLLNKVKIKYINNKSSLDYSCDKFAVNSSQELDFLWAEYIKAKDAANRYKSNTDSLNYYNDILIGELSRFQVADPEVWVYQAIAIIDNKEMVEVRHRLNVRRQKLRELIEYNLKLKENGIKEIESLLKKYPDFRPEIITILGDYRINI